jgi:hypothetical protein
MENGERAVSVGAMRMSWISNGSTDASKYGSSSACLFHEWTGMFRENTWGEEEHEARSEPIASERKKQKDDDDDTDLLYSTKSNPRVASTHNQVDSEPSCPCKPCAFHMLKTNAQRRCGRPDAWSKKWKKTFLGRVRAVLLFAAGLRGAEGARALLRYHSGGCDGRVVCSISNLVSSTVRSGFTEILLVYPFSTFIFAAIQASSRRLNCT